MAVTLASASAVGRASVMGVMAGLTVNGIKGWFCDQVPTEMYAVAWLCAGNLIDPAVFTVLLWLDGQSAMRPFDVAAVVSVKRSGLSTTSDSTLLWKYEP